MLACIIKIVTCKQDAAFPKSVTFKQSSGGSLQNSKFLAIPLACSFPCTYQTPNILFTVRMYKGEPCNNLKSRVLHYRGRNRTGWVFMCTYSAIIKQLFLLAFFYGLIYKPGCFFFFFLHPNVSIGLADTPFRFTLGEKKNFYFDPFCGHWSDLNLKFPPPISPPLP